MFNTKNIVLDERNIPSTWVFQYYLNLPEQLTGQNIKIKSIFNPNDKTPSFCIYVNETIMQYKFKDFSTGKNGNKVDLVKSMFNIEYPEASRKIVKDYNMFVKTNGVQKIDHKGLTYIPGEIIGPFFKFGLYQMSGAASKSQTHVIYFDEYRRGKSYQEVDPAQNEKMNKTNQ